MAARTGEGHEWLRTMFDESPVAIGFSRDGVMLDANPAYVRLFGFDSVEELCQRTVLDLIAPVDRARVAGMITHRALGERLPESYRTLGLRKDGTEFPFEVTLARVAVADGPLSIAFIVDVAERDRAFDAMTASEERFRMLSNASFEAVFIHDGAKVLLANDASATMYGFTPESMVGVAVLDLAADESREFLREQIRRGASEPYEGIARRKDGSTFVAEVRGRTLVHQGRPMRVSVVRDITERKRIEAEQRALDERIRQVQKLEGLGLLAGGVAHDFNNILTVISNEVAVAQREAVAGAVSPSHLDAIADATERAAELCRQMLAYAGKARFDRAPVDLSALVEDMTNILVATVAKRAALKHDLAAGLSALFGDATQIRQIVMNLVLNAAEASRAGGTIRLATGGGHFDASTFVRSPAGGDLRSGSYVWLEVSDDGIGMDANTVAQMFDPFFTTKFVGRGLGMAAVLGIIRGHEGAIEVESAPERGTRVRVYFPAHGPAPRATPKPSRTEVAGEGLVLVVDDEKNVRISTEMLLRGFGFDVLTASDGLEALTVVGSRRREIDVVLLDLTMPSLDGARTLVELRRLAPEIPIVLASGYGSMALDAERGDGVAPDAVLAKPYVAERLIATLKGVMRRASASR